MNIPNFTSYGQYSSSNYGAHTLQFSLNGDDYYFSYRTLVAFRRPSTGLVVRENVWGPTTGKHLNWIDGGRKKERLTHEQFDQALLDWAVA